MTDYIVRIVPAKQKKRTLTNEYVGTYRADSADSALAAAKNDPYVLTLPPASRRGTWEAIPA